MRKVLHILGYFNEEDTAWIAQVGEKKSISEGSFLIKYKEALANVYFVLDGRFKIQQPNGAEVATIKSGEILGEMSFVNLSKHVSEVELLSVSTIHTLLTGGMEATLG